MNLEELVPERFRVFYNQSSNSFKILDTWHPSIKNLNLETNPDIPDDSPAVKTITAEEVNSIVGELIKLGWLDKMLAARSNKEQNSSDISSTTRRPSTAELIIEKIAAIVLDDGSKPEPHSSVSKEAIATLREIAKGL
jgi:hypothetical protein